MPVINNRSTSFNVSMPSADLELLDNRLELLRERARTFHSPSRAKLIRLALGRLFQLTNEEIEAELERWKL